MFRARIGYDPDRLPRLDTHEVSEELPEVIVIALLQLVLDHDGATVLVLSDKVNAEGTRGLLPLGTDKRKSCGCAEDIQIFLQPSREVAIFALPQVTQVDPLELVRSLASRMFGCPSLDRLLRRGADS